MDPAFRPGARRRGAPGREGGHRIRRWGPDSGLVWTVAAHRTGGALADSLSYKKTKLGGKGFKVFSNCMVPGENLLIRFHRNKIAHSGRDCAPRRNGGGPNYLGERRGSLRWRYFELFTDAADQILPDLTVPGNSRPLAISWILPNRMSPALAFHCATMLAQVAFQISQLHTAGASKGSRSD